MHVPGDFERILVVFGLGASRTVPFAWLVPAFGGPTLPGQVRLALGLALSALCFPVIAGQVLPQGPIAWVLLLFREVGVGVVMGFVVACLFRAVEAAGRLTDVLRGTNLAEVISPLSAARSSPLGNLFLLFAVVIFLEIGGAGYLAMAMARSYEAMPVAATASGPARAQAAAFLVVAASAKLIEAAVGLAAPALVALLLADLTLGALGRVVPQIQLYFVGMPAKALLGVGTVLAGLATLDATLTTGFRAFWALLERAAQLGR